MKVQLERIARMFAEVAREEDKQLTDLCGEGIFFMPELAFAYACGKAVMRDRAQIFGDTDVRWIREENFGGGGPTDLAFGLRDRKKIVVEFKMRATLPSYVADIAKLQRLSDPTVARIFCALVDVFAVGPPDGRLQGIESPTKDAPRLTRLNDPFPSFPTRQHWYDKKVSCVVAAWSVGEIPEMQS